MDTVGSAVAALPSTGHRRAFEAVLASVLGGSPAGVPWGVLVTGDRGMGRGTFLRALAAVLPPDRVRLVRLEADAAPDDLARLLDEAEPFRAAGGRRTLLVVPGADALPRDLLGALDQLARTLSEAPRGLQLLLLGEDTLLDRLKAAHHHDLMRYLARELVLAPLTPAEAEGYLATLIAALAPAERPGRTRRTAILAYAAGNPHRLRRALDRGGDTPDLPVPLRDTLPWRRVVQGGALLAILAGVAAIFIFVTENPDPANDVGIPGWTTPDDPAEPPLLPGRGPPAPLPPVASARRPAIPPPVMPPVGPPLATQVPTQVVPPDGAGSASSHPALPPARLAGAGSGLIIVAQSGDSLARLYRQVYAGLAPPAFGDVQAVNPQKIKPGTRVLFPRPPGGWQRSDARPPSE